MAVVSGERPFDLAPGNPLSVALLHPARSRQAALIGRGALVPVLLICTLLAGTSSPVRAQAPAPSENDVKAAFLYHFSGYVEWPTAVLARGGDSFLVCLLGGDPFGSMLDAMVEGKTLHDKKLKVKRIAELGGTSDCHILFINSSQEGRLAEILSAVAGQGVLTVGDMRRFAQRGGMIGFTLDRGRVRFDINLEAAQREGLSLSAQLLKVARIIGAQRPSGD